MFGVGVYPDRFKFTCIHEPITFMEFGRNMPVYLNGTKRVEATMLFRIENNQNYLAKIYNMLNSQMGRYQRFLGSGVECQYCQTVYPIGTLVCSQCEGNALDTSGILEMESEAIIQRINFWNHMHDVDFVEIDIIYPLGITITEGINFGNWREWALYFLFGVPTHWLCQYCGLFVDRDRVTCPGCGGNRLSAREIASLDRQCIYCLCDVRGGYICSACSGRLRPLIKH